MPIRSTETAYKSVRGLSRGLEVLRAVSLIDKIDITVADISKSIGLHRTTVQRLLETLISDGYVRRGEANGTYRLASRVHELSQGFTEAAWISNVAADEMVRMTEIVVWPVSLSTNRGDSMIIRETTHRISRLSFHHGVVGRKLPLLCSASGRAYFGALPEKDRQEILAQLIGDGGPQASYAGNKRFIQDLLTQVQSSGYASNVHYSGQPENTSSLAMPVRHRGKVVAALNIVYLTSAVVHAEAIRRFIPHLAQAVENIADALVATEKLPDV